MNNPCMNCSNRKCSLSLIAFHWDACVASGFKLYPQMRSQRIKRKRFERILKAVGFERNAIDSVCKAAIRDFGSYGNAYKYSNLKKMYEKTIANGTESEADHAE